MRRSGFHFPGNVPSSTCEQPGLHESHSRLCLGCYGVPCLLGVYLCLRRAGHAETINLETMEKGECNIVMWEAERNALVLELKDDIHVPLIGYTWVRTGGIAYPEDPGTSLRVSALGQLVAETMCDVIGYEVSSEREILVAIQNRNSFPITFGGRGGPIMRMEFHKGVCLRPRVRGCLVPENVKEVRHRRAHRESKKAIWAREARARERDRNRRDHGLQARWDRDEDRRRIGVRHASDRAYKCRECRRALEGKAKVPSLILHIDDALLCSWKKASFGSEISGAVGVSVLGQKQFALPSPSSTNSASSSCTCWKTSASRARNSNPAWDCSCGPPASAHMSGALQRPSTRTCAARRGPTTPFRLEVGRNSCGASKLGAMQDHQRCLLFFSCPSMPG